MRTFLKSLIKDNRGASAVEYGLIAGMIAVAAISAFNGVAGETMGMWNDISTRSANAIGGGSGP